jgi:4a-hydroxytetrahydrobiopterin dehydratase
MELTKKVCVACSGDLPPMKDEEIQKYRKEVPHWNVIQENSTNKIERTFSFNNFKEAIAFVNKVAAIAEAEQHHPNIFIHEFKKVKLILYTHAIKGLHENDFIVAAKIDGTV